MGSQKKTDPLARPESAVALKSRVEIYRENERKFQANTEVYIFAVYLAHKPKIAERTIRTQRIEQFGLRKRLRASLFSSIRGILFSLAQY
jgi:hypothetical protein